MNHQKKIAILSILAICAIILVLWAYTNRHQDQENTIRFETTEDGSIKVFDASNHQILILVEMPQTYITVNEYKSQRIDSGSILLDCAAASPSSIQQCGSITSTIVLRNDSLFAAKYSLKGEVLRNDTTDEIAYDIFDILLPNGTLLSGIVGSSTTDEELRVIANSIKKY